MLAWLSVWSKVQTCHSLSLASVKSRLVLPFWYRLTWVVPEKRAVKRYVFFSCFTVPVKYQAVIITVLFGVVAKATLKKL